MVTEADIRRFFEEQTPQAWFSAKPQVIVDREEMLVVGRLSEPKFGENDDEASRSEARVERIQKFRADTRRERIRIASRAQHKFGGTVSWGAECGDERVLFTTLSVPVMTRLRMRERAVLDTLVSANVARSRSEALAWCVRLVEQNESDWIDELRDALTHVDKVRADGPAGEEATVERDVPKSRKRPSKTAARSRKPRNKRAKSAE